MIPYGDDVGGSKGTWVTGWLITIMSVIYLAELFKWINRDHVEQLFALRPDEFLQSPIASSYRLVTLEFLHADFFHVLFNMIYLFAFGRTVEKILGWWTYLALFLVLGFTGSVVDALIYHDSDIPRLGASGSISAVMGLYLSLAYWARIKTYFGYMPGLSGGRMLSFSLPSWVILIYWIVLQLFSLGAPKESVAYDVHIVCFIIGIAAGQVLKRTEAVQNRLDDIHSHPPHLNVF